MTMKKILVIGSINYANFLDKKLFNEELQIDVFSNISQVKDYDIILFTGGEDVDPSFYGETPHYLTYSNISRDNEEIKIFDEARSNNKFLIGICRGAQFLTVCNGGRLIQHVNNHTSSHEIETMDGNFFKVTSTHHQMMYPFKINFSELAWTPQKLSNLYFKNTYHLFDKGEVPYEPEIIYFSQTRSLCIQPHPEMMNKDDKFVIWLNNNIIKLLKDKNVKLTSSSRRVLDGKVEKLIWPKKAFSAQIDTDLEKYLRPEIKELIYSIESLELKNTEHEPEENGDRIEL